MFVFFNLSISEIPIFFTRHCLTTGIFCIDFGLLKVFDVGTLTKWLPSDLFDYLPMQLEELDTELSVFSGINNMCEASIFNGLKMSMN